MLSRTKQRKRESGGETMSGVIQAQEVRVCPYINFALRIVLEKIHY